MEPIVIGLIERTEPLRAANFGLTLAEAKSLLVQLQRQVFDRQLQQLMDTEQHCSSCGTYRAIKDYRPAQFKSLFGCIALRVPRLYSCRCHVH